jgi:hypothetical protein
MAVGLGQAVRAMAHQVQVPEFKPQFWKKKKKTRLRYGREIKTGI